MNKETNVRFHTPHTHNTIHQLMNEYLIMLSVITNFEFENYIYRVEKLYTISYK